MSDSGRRSPGRRAAPDVAAEPAAPRVPLGNGLGRMGPDRLHRVRGGPPTHIKLLRELCVQRKGWLDGQEFEGAIAVCNLLPGPASTQLAIFCAWRLRRPASAPDRRCRVHHPGPDRHPRPVGAVPGQIPAAVGPGGGCGRGRRGSRRGRQRGHVPDRRELAAPPAARSAGSSTWPPGWPPPPPSVSGWCSSCSAAASSSSAPSSLPAAARHG